MAILPSAFQVSLSSTAWAAKAAGQLTCLACFFLGIFTAPYDGRYLITATLTPERDAYVEAVLSVANASVAQLHTAGYRREFLEYHRPPGAVHTCGGPGAFHLIVHLKAGDGVNVVVTGGRLAHTDFDEMYSTFSGVFLYPFLSHL